MSTLRPVLKRAEKRFHDGSRLRMCCAAFVFHASLQPSKLLRSTSKLEIFNEWRNCCQLLSCLVGHSGGTLKVWQGLTSECNEVQSCIRREHATRMRLRFGTMFHRDSSHSVPTMAYTVHSIHSKLHAIATRRSPTAKKSRSQDRL